MTAPPATGWVLGRAIHRYSYVNLAFSELAIRDVLISPIHMCIDACKDREIETFQIMLSSLSQS
jgi:hypothetical protein